MEIYEQVKNEPRTQLAIEFLTEKEISPGDYQILIWDAMKNKKLAEDIMYALHAPNLKVGYRKDMEKGFETIQEGKLEGELVN